MGSMIPLPKVNLDRIIRAAGSREPTIGGHGAMTRFLRSGLRAADAQKIAAPLFQP